MLPQLLRITLALSVLAAALTREAPRPAPTERRPDIELKSETVTVEARVPRSATLDSLLRQHRSPPTSCNPPSRLPAASSIPRQLRADRPYRLVRTFDGLLREFEYQIDADRFLRIIATRS